MNAFETTGLAAEHAPRDIETITGEILEAKRVGGEAIITIGQRLIEAKAVLEHGEWLPWLNERVEFSERTARNFMRLAREWTNRQALADLGAAKALALLALPESEREEFLSENHAVDGQEKTVIDMTSRELEKAIRERNEARKAAEQDKADREAAEAARDKLSKELKLSGELLESAKADQAEARKRAEALQKELEELKAKPVDVAVQTVPDPDPEQEKKIKELEQQLEYARTGRSVVEKQLEKVKTAQKAAEEQRKAAEEALEAAERKRQEAERALENAGKQAVLSGDADLAAFGLLFDQVQETVNKMHGIKLKLQAKDSGVGEKLTKALLALAEAVRGCAA